MIVYKLTDLKGRSYGGTQWGENVIHTATGKGLKFCSPDLIHAYAHPLLAVLLNPLHANFDALLLWEAEGEVVASDHGLKLGFKTLTILHSVAVPQVTTQQRVRFAILCALTRWTPPTWADWARKWLDGTDCSRESAKAMLSRLEKTPIEHGRVGWAAALAVSASAVGAVVAALMAAEIAEAAEPTLESSVVVVTEVVGVTKAVAVKTEALTLVAAEAVVAAASIVETPLDLVALAEQACRES